MTQIITKRITSIRDKCICPQDYIQINVLSWHKKDTTYYELSPYYLRTDGNEEQKNDGNVIFENFWQGSKVYEEVTPIEHYPHASFRGNHKYLLWKYDKTEKHIINDKITPEYYMWRESLYKCNNAIRYPVGYNNRHMVKYALLNKKNGEIEKLDYLTSRKRIYCNEYMRLIRNTTLYKNILKLLLQNKKICIFEIDVPAKNKKGLYGKYADADDDICYITYEKLENLLNDSSEPFGHGLALAMALLEDINKINNLKNLKNIQKEIDELNILLENKYKEYKNICEMFFK